MREIKFRAWIKDSKDVEEKDKNKMIELSGFDFGDPFGDLEFEDDGEFYCVHHRHCEVMQYTGITDKNENEIYEGDIISHEIMGYGSSIGVVEFRGGCFMVKTTKKIHPEHDGYVQILSPILLGNIYENPELVK